MSRSNPTINTPNPSQRWFEWNGETGELRYYDKQEKKNITIKSAGFTFLLLDQLATVKGWHEPSESGIASNEVRDTRVDPLLVKAFKGGKIAEGLYADIRDRVAAYGGYFVTNCYIGFKEEKTSPLKLGSIQFKGAALNAWVEFSKAHRKGIYEQAVMITGAQEGKKGKVVFQTPTFKLVKIGEVTEKQAIAMDIELQEYLKGYFERTRLTAVERVAAGNGEEMAGEPESDETESHETFRTKPGTRTPAGGDLPTNEELAVEADQMDDVPF